MEYPCAQLYTILSSHVNTTNIFKILMTHQYYPKRLHFQKR